VNDYGYGTTLDGWPGIPADDAKVSQAERNKRAALRQTHLTTILVPGTTKHVTVERDCAPLFAAFLADWNRTVLPLDARGALGPDGWEYREARTGAGLSCHAGGVAVDIRYDFLTAEHREPLNATQVHAVHALLDRYVLPDGHRIFGWGGDWSATYLDPMHVEVIQSWEPGAPGRDGTRADVKAVIAHLGIRPDGTSTVITISDHEHHMLHLAHEGVIAWDDHLRHLAHLVETGQAA
jgi:hypothetical protein